jgi:hypothetical protein
LKTERKQPKSNQVGVAREEKRLVSRLISAIQKTRVARKRLMIASELDCFQGIADVVAGLHNGYRLFPGISKRKLHFLSFSSSKILSALAEKRKTTVPKVAGATGLSTSTVRAELNLLQKLGILRTKSGGRIAVVHIIRPPFKEIVAYEVKVKDWRSGIYQARNYKSFAHKVSVALPLTRANLLANRLPEFRRMRVGLVGIGSTGQLKWLLKPRRQKPISAPRHYHAAVRLLRSGQ